MYNYPDDKGHFGIYGGRFASETLIPALDGAPITTDTCAVTGTVSGFPYVDLLEDGRVCVAVGGNGKAAKIAASEIIAY